MKLDEIRLDTPVKLSEISAVPRLGEMLDNYDRFDFKKIKQAWVEIPKDFPALKANFPENFGPHSLLESIAILHVLSKWTKAFDEFVRETQDIPNDANISVLVDKFRDLVNLSSDNSIWINSDTFPQATGVCFDNSMHLWNDTTSSLNQDLRSIDSLESLERLLAKYAEKYMRIAMIRHIQMSHVHLFIVHAIRDESGTRILPPDDPFHHAMHQVNQELTLIYPISELQGKLREKYKGYLYPYPLKPENYSAEFPLYDREVMSLRDILRDSLREGRSILDIAETPSHYQLL